MFWRCTFSILLIAGFASAAMADELMASASGPPCVPPGTSSLKVTLRPQKTDMWCWAASGEMVMEYFGKLVDQCTQAYNRFGRSDCCMSPTPKECIVGGWPEFEKYGFVYKTTVNAALSWENVEGQLAPHVASINCGSSPFAFTWRWIGGGGHMMVATGYKIDSDGKRYVFVNNPWEPNVGNTQIMLYDVYVEQADDHTHWNDYYDVKTK